MRGESKYWTSFHVTQRAVPIHFEGDVPPRKFWKFNQRIWRVTTDDVASRKIFKSSFDRILNGGILLCPESLLAMSLILEYMLFQCYSGKQVDNREMSDKQQMLKALRLDNSLQSQQYRKQLTITHSCYCLYCVSTHSCHLYSVGLAVKHLSREYNL